MLEIDRNCQWKNKLNLSARTLYHICIIIYLMTLLLERYQWDIYGRIGLFQIGIQLKPFIHIILTGLLIEKIIRLGKKAIPSILLTAAGWIVGEEYLLSVCLFTAVSDLAVERKTIRIILWIDVMAVLMTLLLHWAGYIQNNIIDFEYAKAHTIGFGHSNFPGGMILAADIVVWILYLKKKPVYYFLLFWISSVMTWFVFACRTAAILQILFPIIYLGINVTRGKGRTMVVRIATMLPLLCIAGTIFIILSILNNWMSWNFPGNMMARFIAPVGEIRDNGISWIHPSFSTWIPIDSQYAYTLLYGGILGLALLLVQMTFCAYYAGKRNRMDLLVVCVGYTIYGLMESAPTILLWNFIPLVILAIHSGQVSAEEKQAWPAFTFRTKVDLIAILAGVFLLAAILLPGVNEVPDRKLTGLIKPKNVGAIINNETDEYQTFIAEEPFTGFQVLAATYRTFPIGQLEATLQDAKGNILEKVQIPGWNAKDNTCISIPFNKEYPAGSYRLQFRAENILLGHLSLWQNDQDAYPEGALYINGEETDSDWSFRLYNGGISGKTILWRECLFFWLMLAIGIWMVPDVRRKASGSRE